MEVEVEVEGEKKGKRLAHKVGNRRRGAAVTLAKCLPSRLSPRSLPRTSSKLSGRPPSVSPHTCATLLMLICRSMCPIVAHGARCGGSPGRVQPSPLTLLFLCPLFFFFFALPGGSEARSGDSAVTALECDSADGPSDR